MLQVSRTNASPQDMAADRAAPESRSKGTTRFRNRSILGKNLTMNSALDVGERPETTGPSTAKNRTEEPIHTTAKNT